MKNTSINNNDRKILRNLAYKIQELANNDVEIEKKQRWKKLNSLQPVQSLVICYPENAWNEIIHADDLLCISELGRKFELEMTKEIYQVANIKDDRVIEAKFNINYVFNEPGWGIIETKIGGENGGSYIWDSPLKDYTQLHLLKYPKFEIDYDATTMHKNVAEDLFGDILQVRLKTGFDRWIGSLGLTNVLINLRGMEKMMMDMIDHPDELHTIMAFLRDGTNAKMDFLEKQNLFSLTNEDYYIGSGGSGWTDELPGPDFNGVVKTKDMWGFGESQETVGVSPRMFEEFVFQYQLPLMERFGLICYGCCEPLDKRWSFIKKIPRLRRVSISPWSNREIMADYLKADYIFSLKPHPADLATDYFDEDRIRCVLRADLNIARNCIVEVVMKDTQTIRNNPDRLIRWVEIAREEIENIHY